MGAQQSSKGNYVLNKTLDPILSHVIAATETHAGRVVALTTISNKLFVLRDPSQQQIVVYDSSTFALQQTIKVDGLGDSGSNGLTSSIANNCLFLSDHAASVVYKVELKPEITPIITMWKMKDQPVGLSVNKSNNVLVTCRNKIQEFTPAGAIIREIKLEPGIDDALHAVQLNKSQFAVSHRGPVAGVSLVDAGGRFLDSFRSKPTGIQFKEPQQLVSDASGCLLVADVGANRIVALKPSLSAARDLPAAAVDGGLQGPRCLHYDMSVGRLFAGECDGKRVLVFDRVYNISSAFADIIAL